MQTPNYHINLDRVEVCMRIRRSPSGSLDDDTKLLIEDGISVGLTSAGMHCTRPAKRAAGKYGNIVIIILIIALVVSFFSLQSSLRQLESLNGGPFDPSPLGEPQIRPDGSVVHRLAVVSDLDHDSKDESGKKWISHFKKGELTMLNDGTFSIQWADNRDIQLITEIAAGGRAMELSDLVVFNHRLLTIDDRTGLIYQILNDSAVPWLFLDDGPGNVSKPLKGEWMTVKGDELYVGGLGKEWSTPDGTFINDHPMWVKVIDRNGRIRHINWAENYRKVRAESGILAPGYMVHESVQWSPVHKKWFFLPRRASKELYNDAADENRGTNMLVSADEYFRYIDMIRVGPGVYEGPRGFSAFQFIPGTYDELIIALRSQETDGRPKATHVTVFDIHGEVKMKDVSMLGDIKYEGIAFI